MDMITQELLTLTEEPLEKIPPEAIEKIVAEMDAERMSESEGKYAHMKIYVVSDDDSL